MGTSLLILGLAAALAIVGAVVMSRKVAAAKVSEQEALKQARRAMSDSGAQTRDALTRAADEFGKKVEQKLDALVQELAARFNSSAQLDVLSDRVVKAILSDGQHAQELMRMLTARVADTDTTIKSFVRQAMEKMPNFDKLIAARVEAVFENDDDGDDSSIAGIMKEQVPELLGQMLADPERKKAFWDAISVPLLKRVDEFVDHEIDGELDGSIDDEEERYFMKAIDAEAMKIIAEELVKPDGELRQKLVELLIKALRDKVLDN